MNFRTLLIAAATATTLVVTSGCAVQRGQSDHLHPRFGQLAQFARLGQISSSRDHGICITFKRQQIFHRRKPLFAPEIQAYMPLVAKQGERRRLVRQQRRVIPDAVAVDVDALGIHQRLGAAEADKADLGIGRGHRGYRRG